MIVVSKENYPEYFLKFKEMYKINPPRSEFIFVRRAPCDGEFCAWTFACSCGDYLPSQGISLAPYIFVVNDQYEMTDEVRLKWIESVTKRLLALEDISATPVENYPTLETSLAVLKELGLQPE